MDAVKNLPTPLRFGIPVVLVLVIALVAWMTMFKAPKPTTIVSTQDVSMFNAAKTVLTQKGVQYAEAQQGGTFKLTVTGDATMAAETLAKSGIADRTGLAKNIECPEAPGFTATKAANERADNCTDAKAVQQMLMTAGAIAANVQVSQQANETLLGPEKSKNIVAQVFLPEHMKGKWPAEQAARALSGSIGASIQRVMITDDQLQTLFDGASSGAAKSGEAASSGGLSLGCADIEGAKEIETKKAAVRSCYESTIGGKLTELLGSSERFVLTVEPTIRAAATTTNTTRNTKGPVTGRSTQNNNGSKVEDVTQPANVSNTTKVTPAGAISSMRISVTLDKENVSADQMSAAKSLLASYVDTKRGDPVPVVKMAKLSGGGAAAVGADDELETLKAAAEAEKSAAAAAAAAGPAIKTEMPKWVTAVMAILVIAVICAMLVLWRRSTAMAQERARLEASFQREQRLFEDFASQNPDDLAADLNALFGAPAAPEPNYHA